MTTPTQASLYSLGFGAVPSSVPIISTRAPSTSDVSYSVGQRWIDTANNEEYTLTSIQSFNGTSTANWVVSASGTGILSQLDGDSGSATPSGGAITLAGTANQITTSASGSTVTLAFSSPSFVFPSDNIARQISSTPGGINIIQSTNTSNTAGSGAGFDSIVAGTASGNPYHYFSVTGAAEWIIGIDNADSDTFKISASSALSINTDLTITTGGVVSVVRDDFNTVRSDSGSNVIITSQNTSNTAGSGAGFNAIVGGAAAGDAYSYYAVTAGGNYIVGLDNTDGFYKICNSSALGTNTALQINPSLDVRIAGGDLQVTNGNLFLETAGNKIGIATGANASVGQATLAGGTVTVNTTAVTASSLIFLSRASIGAIGAAATGNLVVGTVVAATSFVINSVQAADATALQASDVSVINWWIVN